MLRYLADEDLNRAIVRGLLRKRPEIDIVRVQDVGLRTQSDEVILDHAAQSERIILTHDARTMPFHAYQRIEKGLPLAALFVIQQSASVGQIIDDLILLAECSTLDEWRNAVLYLPL